jgi:membrane-associated HD superfamily phosphohydrolase
MTTVTANIFEQASRQALRFDTRVGKLSVEDLWQLPLTSANKANLDEIAIELNRQIKTTAEESFVKQSKKDEVLQLRFDIVKHIIETRVAENEAKTEAKKRESQLGKIDDIIAKKKDAALENLSLEELEKLRAGV